MSQDIYIPPGMLSGIVFQWSVPNPFMDMHVPKAGKDEWGIDTLDRTVRGPASRFSAYCDALKQGQAYDKYFFLQTWKPIDHPVFPGVMLSYKGLIANTLPDPLPTTVRSELTSTQTATDLSIAAPTDDDPDRTIVAADKAIKYIAPTTIWRYITRGEPTGPKMNQVRGTMGIQNLQGVTTVTYSDGGSQEYKGGAAPAAVVTALFVSPYVFTIGPSFAPIWGTPFFECEEVCQYKYPDT